MAIQTLNTIKTWFKTGLKPSQQQFWDTWDSFRHKFEKIPLKDVENLEQTLNEKAEKSQLDFHTNNQLAHAALFTAKEDKSQKGIAGGYAPLNDFTKLANQYLDIINDLVSGGTNSILSAEQGKILQNQIDDIHTLLQSDNVNLDTLQEIVNAIGEIELSLNTILVNDLTTGGVTKALTAEMGKLLQSSKEDKSQKGVSGGYAPLNNFAKLANQYLDIVNDLVSGGSTSLLSAEQGKILQNQINVINSILASDDIGLDTLQEIVNAIKDIQGYLNTILINDLITGGVTKALSAEMGKKLNEIKLTATIATDEETQISTAVAEDNKVISRSKLFNWWGFVKSKAQAISAIWTFNNSLRIGDVGYFTFDSTRFYMRAFTGKRLQIGVEALPVDAIAIDSNGIFFYQKLNLSAGSASAPPLIIPNGTITTTPQNGAIERDENGQLWTTHNNKRFKLLEDDGSSILLTFNSPSTVFTETYSLVNATNSTQTILSKNGAFGDNGFFTLKMFNQISLSKNIGAIIPNVVKLEVFIQINNGFLSKTMASPRLNQVKIYEKNNLSIPVGKYGAIFYDKEYSEVLETKFSSWSSITLPLKTDNGSDIVTDYTGYYLINALDNPLPASQAVFNFVFSMTLGFEDATNALNQNVSWRISNTNRALYIEKIK